MLFQQAQGPNHFGAFGQLFDADRRRADAAGDANQSIVRQLPRIKQSLRPFFPHDGRQVQAAQIGIAAAARAEDASTDSNRANIVQGDLSQHQTGAPGCR